MPERLRHSAGSAPGTRRCTMARRDDMPDTGIWQTGWMEPVPSAQIRGVRVTADAHGKVTVHVDRTEANRTRARVVALAKDATVGEAIVEHGEVAMFAIDQARPLSPASPFGYDRQVQLLAAGGEIVDTVTCYFGCRTIALGPDADGTPRLLLNGEPLFQFGPLDQGFWTDGLYTAPTLDAMRFDIDAVRAMGGKCCRCIATRPGGVRTSTPVWSTFDAECGSECPAMSALTARRAFATLVLMVATACTSFEKGDLNVQDDGKLAGIEHRPPNVVLVGESPTHTQAMATGVRALGWTLVRRVHSSDLELTSIAEAARSRRSATASTDLYDHATFAARLWGTTLLSSLQEKSWLDGDLVMTVQAHRGVVAGGRPGYRLDVTLVDAATEKRIAVYYGVAVRSAGAGPVNEDDALETLNTDFVARMSAAMKAQLPGTAGHAP